MAGDPCLWIFHSQVQLPQRFPSGSLAMVPVSSLASRRAFSLDAGQIRQDAGGSNCLRQLPPAVRARWWHCTHGFETEEVVHSAAVIAHSALGTRHSALGSSNRRIGRNRGTHSIPPRKAYPFGQ